MHRRPVTSHQGAVTEGTMAKVTGEIRPAKIEDLSLDPHNANTGTERGTRLIQNSLQTYGAARSIVADRNLTAIAGNKTLEQWGEMGGDVLVVPTDGNTLVVVQRTDLDLETDPRARELAYADNRASEVDLRWDPVVLAQDQERGVDLSGQFTPVELGAIIANIPATGAEYTPMMDPNTSYTDVTPEAIARREQEMSDKLHAERSLIQVICPHCAGEFSIEGNA